MSPGRTPTLESATRSNNSIIIRSIILVMSDSFTVMTTLELHVLGEGQLAKVTSRHSGADT